MKPYKAIERSGYWIWTDTRTNEPASYPTTKTSAQNEARFMNRCYAEALANA